MPWRPALALSSQLRGSKPAHRAGFRPPLGWRPEVVLFDPGLSETSAKAQRLKVNPPAREDIKGESK
jgi:hypothetical protein